MKHGPLLLLCVVAAFTTRVRADAKLAEMFSEHAVLQRDINLPIWGTAAPGEKVTVTLCEQTGKATADEKGDWKLVLPPLAAGGPFELTVSASNKFTLKDILVGEVWLCSGQSNMALPLSEATNAEAEIAAADHPLVRVFRVNGNAADAPQKYNGGAWKISTPAVAGEFSAVAYFFARDLQKHLNIPVGVITAAVGSSFAENWTDRDVLAADPDLRPIVDRADAIIFDWARSIHLSTIVAETWLFDTEAAKVAGKLPPPLPNFTIPPYPMWQNTVCSGMYNGMIAPLAPVAIRGVLWYQGEANTIRAQQYQKLLPALITSWRKQWAQGDFPFLFVQLPNNNPAKHQPVESDWAELRESQLKVSKTVPNTAMAITIDIGEAESIHPRNKQEVGRRLCLLAQSLVFKENIVSTGPIYESSEIAAGHITIHFKNIGAGLASSNNQPLQQFAIAGEDKKFVWADAKLVGDTVQVSNANVSHPRAVRYAWADNPQGCNLINKEGLPASPFRTDTWPGLTDGKK